MSSTTLWTVNLTLLLRTRRGSLISPTSGPTKDRLSRCRHRSLFPPCHRLVDTEPSDNGCRAAGVADGCLRRKPKEKVLVHSDQGSKFTSMDWASFLKHHNLVHSMSRRGNCHDNAVAESFFNLLSGSGYAARSIAQETKPGRTCSTTSRCSTTRSANMSEAGCCRPSSSKSSRKPNLSVSTKLGAIQWSWSCVPACGGARTA